MPRWLHNAYIGMRDGQQFTGKPFFGPSFGDKVTALGLGTGLGYDLVLLCPNFPRLDDGSSNGGEFVRTRVSACADHGLTILVVEVSARHRELILEHHKNYECLRVSPSDLEQLLHRIAGNFGAIAVHVPTPEMFDALSRQVEPERIAYFFHGSEIRDYRRLYFNYDTPQMERHRRSRDATHASRMEVARNVIGAGRSPMIFVSRYLHSVAERDSGLPIPQGTVIPNFIDGDFYTYRAKSASAARRVLLIRSFETANYAADIAVAAILELLDSPLGETLEFTVCGFGRPFRKLTAPLTVYNNVTLREGVLSREEMRALHAHHGIFLAPSRHDTQGVTMCEAMASGLVPVTHRVGGIPEYVDTQCGEFACDHTPHEFARGVARLASDIEGFLRKSATAAARVRERCGAHATIERELAIIAQCAAPSTRPTTPRVLVLGDGDLVERADPRVVTIRRGPQLLSVVTPELRFDVVLPALDSCRYAYVDADEARAWLLVARTLGTRFAAGSVIVVRADDALLPLALMLKKHYAIDYVLTDLTPLAASGVRACAALSAAQAVLVAPGVELASIAAKYVGPLRVLNAPLAVDTLLRREVEAPPVVQAAGRLRVLLVAYYAGPCKSVGVARPNYWFDEFDRLSGERTEIHLATAMRPVAPSARIHFVPDLNGIALTERADLPSPWVSEFVGIEAERAHYVNTLGYFWRVALERYFARTALSFDVVVISGNPFACFDFAAFAHAQWGARVVLDYRDPFALNPRFKYEPAALNKAIFIEAGYNFQADLILAVNEECVELVVGHGEHRTEIVANGYDERIAAAVVPAELDRRRINFVHAGSLYYYGRVEELLGALEPARHCLHHVGHPPALSAAMVESGVLELHGLQPYPIALSIVAGADCGIVFLTDSGFESTTKIFDYLCFDLDVLVISPDDTPRGALAEIANAGGKLHWVCNTREALAEFLTNYQPSQRRPGFGERYSRAESTRRFLRLLGVLERESVPGDGSVAKRRTDADNGGT